jgi:N-acetylmuramoyl-L-alanine amidase
VEVIYTRKTDVFIELDKRGDIANKAHANLFISIHANSVVKGRRCPSGAETFVMGNSKDAAHMEVARQENAVILFEDDYTTRYEGFDPNKPESYITFSFMQNSYMSQSIEFAAEIQHQLKKNQRVDRGVKQGPMAVLWRTAMPGVLVELGFICNPEEEKFMTSAAGKDKLAASIFQAFSSYKAKIEDRSSFLPSGNTNIEPEIPASKPETKTSKPETSNLKPETQTLNGVALAEGKPETQNLKPETQTLKPETQTPKPETSNLKPEVAVSKKVEFCVQILVTSQPIDTNSNRFKKHRNVERIQTSANVYKYILGRTGDSAAAQETLKKVRADFNDAFLVSIVDGKLVPFAEGLKLINN